MLRYFKTLNMYGVGFISLGRQVELWKQTDLRFQCRSTAKVCFLFLGYPVSFQGRTTLLLESLLRTDTYCTKLMLYHSLWPYHKKDMASCLPKQTHRIWKNIHGISTDPSLSSVHWPAPSTAKGQGAFTVPMFLEPDLIEVCVMIFTIPKKQFHSC